MTTNRVPVQLRPTIPLSVPRGAALYIGALLGPGLLLLPGLAAAQAGPASVLAWAGLIIVSAMLAAVFTALGRQVPQAGGVAGYAAAGLGRRAGTVASWCFLAGVVCGAPIVCLIGAGYVAELTGGGQLMRALLAGGLLLAVLGLALGGVRASTLIQLVLVALLIVVVVVAVAGSAPSSHAANWAPFAPHGWPAIGRAASTLMLSFVGWEAVAPLTTRFRDPARQLPGSPASRSASPPRSTWAWPWPRSAAWAAEPGPTCRWPRCSSWPSARPGGPPRRAPRWCSHWARPTPTCPAPAR